jgi:hypothetical protein
MIEVPPQFTELPDHSPSLTNTLDAGSTNYSLYNAQWLIITKAASLQLKK